ncbi:MAG: hypothetical protein HQL73_12950 [Magnetococcales bacterium]|nr:hypothetical protein [Magnetococcales bacterium]
MEVDLICQFCGCAGCAERLAAPEAIMVVMCGECKTVFQEIFNKDCAMHGER